MSLKSCVEIMLKYVILSSAQSMFEWFCHKGDVVINAGVSMLPGFQW